MTLLHHGRRRPIKLEVAVTTEPLAIDFENRIYTMRSAARAILSRLVEKYKTQFEISQRTYMRYSAQRGRYICQGQSLNFHKSDPTMEQMQAYHSECNKMGVKTGMYYFRQDPAKFTGSFSLPSDTLLYHRYLTGLKETRPAKPVAVPVAVPVAPAGSCRRDQPNCTSCD